MTRRRPRVPGTTSREFVTDVPTGGDPIRALIRARDLLPVPPDEVWAFEVHHDTGCPAIEAGTDRCTCEVIHVHARRAA